MSPAVCRHLLKAHPDAVHQTIAFSPRTANAKIQDYGIIGDSRAVALVSREGSIDWLCWPRFDSPAIFAALLDPEIGGYWRILPAERRRTERKYIEATNILETRFHCPDGSAVAIDLMPVASEEHKRHTPVPAHEIVRQIECTRGEVQVEIDFRPRSHYGLSGTRIREAGRLGLRVELDKGVLWLRGNIPLVLQKDSAGTHARLRAGETIQFSLTYAEESPAVLPPLGEQVLRRIEQSATWWQRWARSARYHGRYGEAVTRSALALKLLTYAPSGAIVAAPTTSLPERLGGALNWDYRYCWLRDASLSMRALLGLGYWEEANAFLEWLLGTTSLTQPKLRTLYTVYGTAPPRETELQHLQGYCGSRPIRIGNAARDQLQLDVYGEVTDAAAQYAYHGGTFDRDTQRVLAGIGKYVARNWQQPDHGIWEPRNAPEHHTHSRVLCWTALDRLRDLNEKGKLEGIPRDRFQSDIEQIERDIRERGWNERLQSYVSVFGGEGVDASLLQLSWYGFEKADSERMKATYRRICKLLRAGKNLLYRYRLDPEEGAFGVCGFWEVEHLALGGGTLGQAHQLFQQLLEYGNDLGLFAEEIDPRSSDALGNFPQAFTHVGLISAALAIEEREQGKVRPHLQREPRIT